MNLDHVAINVNNLKDSVAWYVANLQAKIKYVDDTWALLEIGNTKLALTIPEQHPPHIAFEVKAISDFPAGNISYHRDGSAYLYVQDPNNNVIEYICWPKELDNDS